MQRLVTTWGGPSIYLCDQGMTLCIMTLDYVSKRFIISYVHIPFGTMAIVRLAALHSEFYGSSGRKSLHAVVHQKRKPVPLEKLIYFEDFMASGVFQTFEEGEKGYEENIEYLLRVACTNMLATNRTTRTTLQP